MFFCRFPVIVCSVYAVLCNMKYLGTHVFLLPFLSKNRMPFMLLWLSLSGSCPCLRGCFFYVLFMLIPACNNDHSLF